MHSKTFQRTFECNDNFSRANQIAQRLFTTFNIQQHTIERKSIVTQAQEEWFEDSKVQAAEFDVDKYHVVIRNRHGKDGGNIPFKQYFVQITFLDQQGRSNEICIYPESQELAYYLDNTKVTPKNEAEWGQWMIDHGYEEANLALDAVDTWLQTAEELRLQGDFQSEKRVREVSLGVRDYAATILDKIDDMGKEYRLRPDYNDVDAKAA